MGYPENVLAADERVVLHRHPHWKRLFGPVLILLVATALAAFGAGFVNQTDWQRPRAPSCCSSSWPSGW